MKNRKFHYWSYRDGVCGTICGQTAIGALKKEFGTEDIVWSHGSVTHDQGIYVVTTNPDIDGQRMQFSVTIRKVAKDGGELR
jgi:hypothetical protein